MTLSIKQINRITELHQQGLSIRQIAKKTKKNKNTVNKYINKFRYNKLPQLNLFLDEKLKQKNHVSKPYQPNSEPCCPQVHHHHYYSPEDTSLFEQKRQYIDQENKRREQEKEQLEQARKPNQRNWELLRQLKMDLYSIKQKQKRHMQLKPLAARLKILQDDNELNKEIPVIAQEVKEEDIKKVQDNQQVKEMHPRLVKVELKEASVHQEAQDDEIQTLKQAEENVSLESDNSEILEGIVLGVILGLCEGIESYRPPDSKGLMNQYDKYLKNNRKTKRVNLIIKR